MEVTGKSPKETYNNAATKVADRFADSFNSNTDKVMDKAKDLESTLASRYSSLKESASEGFETATGVVKKYPMSTVIASAAIGALAGIWLSRRD